MRHYFRLTRSPTELHAIYALLGLAGLIAFGYLQPGTVRNIYLLALALLAIGETRCYRSSRVEYLCIDGARCGIVADTAGQPYFANKYKVYRTRWFAILRLWNRHHSRTEMLFPDRFESPGAYQDCRFLLRDSRRP